MADPTSASADDPPRDEGDGDGPTRAAEDADADGTTHASAADRGNDAEHGHDAERATTDADGDDGEDLDALRRAVEEKYDFESFGPKDMAEMSADEWEAVFDPETWVVGDALLDRVERDLRARIARRDVFAVVERVRDDDGARLIAYSDEGYAVVYPDGSVAGEGTVLRDVKPSIALCSMEDYEVPEAPGDVSLPSPEDVVEGSGEFGNLMLQIVAAVQLLAGVGLFGVWLLTDLVPGDVIVAPVLALGFVLIGLFLFVVVANARLSDRFRAEEFRGRLRAVGVEEGERPEFLPEESAPTDDADEAAT